MRRLLTACALASCVISPGPLLAADAAPSADARAGERLFVGRTRLANGGAPCLACHALSGRGLAWSASFGPDLTASGEAYDAETLGSILEDVQLPSMEPVYRGRPITARERADLAVFLLEPRTPAVRDGRLLLAVEAGVGALLLGGAFAVVARRRMPRVKDALARRAQGGSR
jgi:mono/diheme cytochrome c family protein